MVKEFRLCSTGYRWPEAIDFDSEGNLYFTDGAKRALYRIKRDPASNKLAAKPDMLLQGFSHVGGIDISGDCLFLGMAKGKRKNLTGHILQIPIRFFNKNKHLSVSEKMHLLEIDDSIINYPLDDAARPNGVVSDPVTEDTFYTNENMVGGISKGKFGNIGSTKSGKIKDLLTPNGLALQPFITEPVLFASLLWKNAIIRITNPNNYGLSIIQLDLNGNVIKKNKMSWLKRKIGPLPDGVLCYGQDGEFRGILVAAWFWRCVINVPWEVNSFGKPYIIAEGLDQPTDLAIGAASDGSESESLYITTMTIPRAIFGMSNIIEVTGLQEKLGVAST